MHRSTRRLVAILFTDIVGSTAIMQKDEQTAVSVNKRYVTVLKQCVLSRGGEILNDYGDGSLCCFSSATEAMQCAIEIQKELQTEPKVPLRIGLHVGEIFFDDGKVLGDGVNVASRVQSLGIANSILFSAEINSKIKNQQEFKTVSLGKFHFKNVDGPMAVFALTNDGLAVPKKEQIEGKLKNETSKNNLSAVRKLILTAGIVLLVMASIFLYNYFNNNKFTGKDKSIAVLPFKNMSGNKDNEYFSDGITEEITTQLAKIAHLKVISRTTAMLYKNSKKSVKEIAEEMSVSSILEGSVQQSGKEIRITAQLIDANTQEHIWAEHYDQKNLNDLFSMQSEVAQNIAEQLDAHLSSEEKNNIEKKSTTNPEAYNLYLKGRYFWNKRNAPSLKKGIVYFDSAIALDPMYSKAYSGMADCYASLGYGSFLAPSDAALKAQAAALKALQLDSTLAEPHASLGYIKFYYSWDWHGAEQEFLKAISLNPNYEIAYDWYGVFLTAMGRLEDARKVIEKAQQIAPLSAFINTDMGFNLYYGKNYDKAIQSLKSTIDLNFDFLLAHLWLARTYQAMKMYKEALEEYQTAQTIAPNWVPTVAGIGNIYGLTGQKIEAKKILDSLKEMSAQKYVTPYGVALVYAGLGETDKVFEYLEKAYQDRSNWLVWLKLDPRWDSVRSDKRFIDLVKKVGLPS